MGAAILGADTRVTPVPLQVSGLVLWLKTDVGTFQDVGLTTLAAADGTLVKGWVDQSGQSNNATQNAGATLKLGIQNGRSVLRFNGTTNYLEVANGTQFLVNSTHNLTWLFAAHWPAVANKGLLSAGTTGPDYAGAEHYGFARLAAAGLSVHSGNGNGTGVSLPTDDTWNVVSVLCTGSANSWQVFVNGTSAGTNTVAAYQTPASVAIGRGDGLFFNNDLGELLCYQGLLSIDNRALVEAYLKARWGTP